MTKNLTLRTPVMANLINIKGSHFMEKKNTPEAVHFI